MHTGKTLLLFQSKMHKIDILFLKYAYFSLFSNHPADFMELYFHICTLFYLARGKEKLLTFFISEDAQFLKIQVLYSQINRVSRFYKNLHKCSSSVLFHVFGS